MYAATAARAPPAATATTTYRPVATKWSAPRAWATPITTTTTTWTAPITTSSTPTTTTSSSSSSSAPTPTSTAGETTGSSGASSSSGDRAHGSYGGAHHRAYAPVSSSTTSSPGGTTTTSSSSSSSSSTGTQHQGGGGGREMDDTIARLKTTKDPLELEDIVRRLGAPRHARDYTTIISAWTRAKRPEHALQLFERMRYEDGIEPTLITYNAAISACARAEKADRALELFDEVVHKRKMAPDAYTFNALISACGKGGRWDTALKLFASMKDSYGIDPDPFTYSAAMTACERGGLGEEAVKLLREMQRDLDSKKKNGLLAMTPASLAQQKQDRAFVYAAAMSACAKSDESWPKALMLFDELRKTQGSAEPIDAPAYGAAISACDRGNDWRKARTLISEMRAKGVRPNAATYAHAVSACAKARRFDDAKALFEESKTEARGVFWVNNNNNNTNAGTETSSSSLTTTTTTTTSCSTTAMSRYHVLVYEAMLLACETCGRVTEAVSILDDLRSSSSSSEGETNANTVSRQCYARAIAACDKASDWESALTLLDRAKSDGVLADASMTARAMAACDKAGKWETALRLFDEYNQRRTTTGRSPASSSASSSSSEAASQHSSTSLSSASSTRNDDAPGGEKEQDSGGLSLYAAAISACETGQQADRALELFDELKSKTTGKKKPDAAAYGAILSACEKAGKHDDVLRLFDEMRADNVDPDVIAFGAAVSACAQRGDWAKALTLLDDMRRKDVEPDFLAYASAVLACEQAGRIDFALDVYRAALSQGEFSSHWRSGMLDLVDVPVPVARTALRSAIADAALRPKKRRFHDAALAGDLVILTGHRKSRGAAKDASAHAALRTALLKVFEDELQGHLECRQVQQNAGRLVVPTASLLAWTAARDHMREQ